MKQIAKSFWLLFPFALSAQEIGLFYPREVSQVEFAASEIRAAAQVKKISQAAKNVRVILTISNSPAKAESYFFSKTTNETYTTYLVTGAMYGRLDIAGL